MSKRRVTLLALSSLATAGGLIPATQAHAAGGSIYVGGANCSDTAAGAGSSTTPFCSFAPALAAAGPGDTILVRNLPTAVVNGQNKTAEMDITKSGAAGSPITIKAAPNSAGFLTNYYPATHFAVVTNQHDIVIEGFNTFGAAPGQAAFVVDGGSTGVTIMDNHIQGGGVALSSGATGNAVSANLVEYSDGGVTLTDAPGNAVVGNTLRASRGYQIGVHGSSTGTVIANNITVDGQMAAATTARPTEIEVAATATAGTSVHHNIVFPAQQPFLNPDTGQTYPAGTPYTWGGTAYNDVASFAAASGQGAHDLMVDPQLGGAGLLPTSPAIDSADSSVAGEAATDVHGAPRVDDPKVADTGTGTQTFHDRGAVEYQGAPIPLFKYTITGTPTSETVTVDASATLPGFTPTASYTFNFNGTKITQAGPILAQTFPVVDDPTTAKPFQTLSVTATSGDGQVGGSAADYLTYTLGPVYQPVAKLATSLDAGTKGGVIADASASTPAQPSTIVPNGVGWSNSLITSYVVDWGDGSYPDYPDPWATTAKHAYEKAGKYTVKLTVITGMNISNSTTTQVTVATGSGIPLPPAGGGTTTPPPTGGGTTPPPTGGTTTPPPTGGTTTPPSTPPAQPTVHRIGGDTRYLTALKVSGEQWKDGAANGVVIARGDAAPDALAGVPLAAHVHGPLLLTDPLQLDTATAAEIKRVLGTNTAKDVYVLGGINAVSPAVEKQLTALGYRVHRLGGATRYETALKIAQDGLGTTPNVVVATGADFADALAAGPLAASQNAAIVLSDGATLDPATAAFVQAHTGITAVGGSAKTAVQNTIAAGGKQLSLLWGDDRYETAAKVAAAMAQSGHAPTGVGIASGTVFPDALTGGAYAANAGIPLLLTDPKQLSGGAAVLLGGWRAQLTAVEIFGGPNAVADSVMNTVVSAVHGRAV